MSPKWNSVTTQSWERGKGTGVRNGGEVILFHYIFFFLKNGEGENSNLEYENSKKIGKYAMGFHLFEKSPDSSVRWAGSKVTRKNPNKLTQKPYFFGAVSEITHR